jgi:hypothetical protein
MLGLNFDKTNMKNITPIAILLMIFFRLSSQNLPAQFINLPTRHLSNTIISDYGGTIKFCQYNDPGFFDSFLKIYFSQLNCDQKEITLFDSIELKIQTFKDLGGAISDFAIIDNKLFLLGSKNLVILNNSRVLQNIKNKNFSRILNVQDEILLARNLPFQLEEKSCVVQRLSLVNNIYSLDECIAYKKFTLENLISIYGSSTNLVASNNKDALFYINFEKNTIDKLALYSKQNKVYSFAELDLHEVDSFTLNECMKIQKNYTRNPTEVNFLKLEGAIDSIPHITSISSLKENIFIINYYNMKSKETFFSQLYITQFDSTPIVSREVAWRSNKNNSYTKNYVPYYSLSRRFYAACNQYIVFSSTVDETKLTDTFTFEQYQAVRDENRAVKSIILVNLNE